MSDCMTQEDAMNMNNEQAIQILTPFCDMLRDQNGCPISDAYFAMKKAIEALQAQKTGYWIDKSRGEQKNSECSECHTLFRVLIRDYPYCPCCGSRNRGEEEWKHGK